MGSRTTSPICPHTIAVDAGGDIPDGMTFGDEAESREDLVPAPYFLRAARWQWWVALLLAVPAVPVLLVAMLLVKLTSRGDAIYQQTRVGLHGRLFKLLKVRTMYIDAEARTGPVWTTSLSDPRITPVGRILRWTHFDELPQLWNVLRGEMVLVGPRPERPEFTKMLIRSVPGYLDRLAVLPGVTGLAQINLPADDGLESVRRKLALDVRYIREGTLSLDLRIIVCTAGRILGLRPVWFRQMLGVALAADADGQSAEALVLESDAPTVPNRDRGGAGAASRRAVRANSVHGDNEGTVPTAEAHDVSVSVRRPSRSPR